MRKLILILSILVPILTNGQPKKVKSALTKTIAELKARSLNSDKVDWNVVSNEAFRLAQGAKNVYELGPSIRYLFQSLDDFHGFFKYKDSLFRWQKEKRMLPEIYKAALAKKDNRFFTRSLGNIGYMRIPTTLANIAKERSRTLRDSLCKVLSKNPAGLIFDLRLNGGGHYMAMAMGISNILEYGLVSPEDEIRKDGFFREGENILPFKETCERNHVTIPIAVIVGPVTGSSAEMLTIIMKNRPNTIIIGEPTAGAITGVYGLMIDKKINLGISIAYMTDAKGNQYKTKIQPDILIPGGDDFENLLKDAKISKAVEWLSSQH